MIRFVVRSVRTFLCACTNVYVIQIWVKKKSFPLIFLSFKHISFCPIVSVHPHGHTDARASIKLIFSSLILFSEWSTIPSIWCHCAHSVNKPRKPTKRIVEKHLSKDKWGLNKRRERNRYRNKYQKWRKKQRWINKLKEEQEHLD